MNSTILKPKNNRDYIEVSALFNKSKFGEIILELSYDIEEINGIILSLDQAIQLKNFIIKQLTVI